jgi:hypothetical protein
LKTLSVNITKDVALFNALLWVLNHRTVKSEVLQGLFLQSLPHLELLTLILKHPTFNPLWAWSTLNDPQSKLLPPMNLGLLKSALKIK